MWTILCSFYFGAKNGSPALGMATRSLFVEYRQVEQQLCYFEQNILFFVKLNPEYSS